MTTDDILRMAREANLTIKDDDGGEVSRWREDKDLTPYLERFAALVAAAEREQCAKVCEDVAGLPTLYGTLEGRARAIGLEQGATRSAAAIRARGTK